MLAFSDFRDIPSPLRLTHTATAEPHAELFGAFPYGESLTFFAQIDRGFLTSALSLCFLSDDSGARSFIKMERAEKSDGRYDCFSVTVPLATLCDPGMDNGLFFYRVVADTVYGRLWSHGEDGEADAWLSDKQEFASPYQLTVYRDGFDTPKCLSHGVMYQIFVDRFFRGGQESPREDAVMAESWDAEISQFPDYPGAPVANNLFYGGDLDGVRLKLPYLATLGVTVIYLCPIFEAASNHKYDTGDYARVDAMFGGDGALDRLLAAAKAQGVRVILDGVFNHTGSDSRYFNQYGHYEGVGAYQDKSSPYYHWYRFTRWPNEYDCWWGVRILPTVNSGDPEFIRFIAGDGGIVDSYCRRGVTGFRLDVVDELSPKLVRALRKQIKKRDPEGPLIGEVWEDASNKIAYDTRRRYFRGDELDSVMNYPLKNAILSYLLTNNAEEIFEVCRRLYSHYPRKVSEAMMNLLGTHDTPRILTVLSGRPLDGLSYAEMRDVRLTAVEKTVALLRLRLAFAILYFMPGIPCIYYGDEVGMEGAKDPFNRRTYPWDHADEELRDFFTLLGNLRREQEGILAHGYLRPLLADRGLFALSRFSEHGMLVLAVNCEKRARVYPLDALYFDLITRERQQGQVLLAPYSFCILKKQEQASEPRFACVEDSKK